MSVDLLNQRREKKSRGSSLESRVSALENYIAMLIGTNEIMDGAITTPKLLDGCVSELKIAADAVTNAKIAVDAIQGDVIAAGAITENKLYNGAVTADKIATNAVTTAKIEAGAITAGEIATGAVTATKIYAGAVTADKIATNAVTADKINVSQLSAISANIGSVTAGTITSATVRTNAATHPYAKMDSGGFEVNGRYMTFNKDDGTGIGEVYGSGTYGLMISSFSGKQCYVNGANNLILNAGGGTLQLRHGNDTRAYTSSDSLIISSGLTLGGVRRTSWPSASSGANTSLSNLTTTNLNQALNASTLTLNGTTEVYIRANDVAKLKVNQYNLTCYDDLLASGGGVHDLGSSVSYWGEINYKTWQDRGCLGWFDKGVELRDGRIVSDCEALQAIKKHPTRKTVYGVPMLDYKTLPKVTYTQADEKIKDENGKVIGKKMLPRDKNDRPYKMVKDEKTGKMKKIMAEDGAEMTSMLSIMIGAIKELDNRLKYLETNKKI